MKVFSRGRLLLHTQKRKSKPPKPIQKVRMLRKLYTRTQNAKKPIHKRKNSQKGI